MNTKSISNLAKTMVKLAVALMVTVPAAAQVATEIFAEPQTSHRQIVVSIPDRKLALVEDGRVLKLYPVAVGASVSPSPEGEFKVVNRVANPTYYHPGTVIEPGPQNPLGTRWIGLNQKGYGIHGTNLPKSIGKAASHGCIRMARRDLEELFEIVRPGDMVSIVSELDDETAAIFGAASTVADTHIAAQNGMGGGQ
jgi:lipoprotein-anchoring transpeptidase ErfK/SrfK